MNISFIIGFGKILSEKHDNVDDIDDFGKLSNDTNFKTLYFRLTMGAPENQLFQRIAIKFNSPNLKSETDCSNRFVRLVGYYKEVSITHLTEKLCGTALDDMHVMKYRPWRENVIEYHFGDASAIDLSFHYGIGKTV